MIIYQDEDIVVCEKPYGVSSQKSDKENMVDILTEITGTTVYPVHRLDIQTTGLMVYAKNEKSAGALSAQIADRVFEKEYLCLCHGDISENGEMIDFLYHDRIKNKSFVTKTKRNGAKEARLEFELICKKQAGECELSLVHVKLFTGRTHQIRVQFASRGYPLLGDGKYGARDNEKIHLHSTRIAFLHPKTKKSQEFTSIPSWY
ncbi:MAG: RluA family pseudouridine synthase [Clostridia bacterium]|nr:RluA family pseudouridine synthase [Clostridia bacterium]